MRLLKALVMSMAIMMMSQAAMAAYGGICTSSGGTIECTNTTHTAFIVGENTSEDIDMVIVCAVVSGQWAVVGWADYDDDSCLEIDGNYHDEEITMVETTGTESLCDYENDVHASAFPSYWFEEGIFVHGNEGDDTIYGSYRDEYLYGDSENDTIEGNDGDDIIRGGYGTDYLYGDDGVDYIYGEGGTDTIEGNAGGDYLYGGDDDDDIWGGDGNDYMEGNDGKDDMWGGANDDILWGGAQSDKLYGEDGEDDLYGEGGTDLCNGGVDVAGDFCDWSPSCNTFINCT